MWCARVREGVFRVCKCMGSSGAGGIVVHWLCWCARAKRAAAGQLDHGVGLRVREV